jgi:Cof subfamily protein (haloacid dehalogenase superfamily)
MNSAAISSCTELIRLLVSDIDGTLVSKDKRLTEATRKAAERLRHAGVALALTSSRPPQGIELFAQPLGLRTPRGAFNGAVITAATGDVLSAHYLDPGVVGAVLDYARQAGIAPWLFTAREWLLLDPAGDYVDFEAQTVKMPFRQVPDFRAVQDQAGKIMLASHDTARLAHAETDLQDRLGRRAAVHLSQTYYLDVTHPDGNKGHAVRAIAAIMGIGLAETAVIGDMANDVPMFETAPLSIAMGQSPGEVKHRATHVTASNEDDGWARAVTDIILPQAQGQT